MKALSATMALAVVFMVMGCGEQMKVVEYDKLIERGDLVYEVNSEIPFTGMTVDYWCGGFKFSGYRKMEGELRDGKKHGKWTYWYKNGQKLTEGEYLDGKEHGKWTVWYENGQKKGEFELLDGRLHGQSISWHENGRKMVEGKYSDGKLFANKCWDENGNAVDCANLIKINPDRFGGAGN